MDHIRRLLRASYRHIWRDMGCDAVTALVLSPLFLKSTSVAILVIASIGDLFTPYAHLGNSLPAQLYAYGMLAYSTNAIIVATLLIYYVVNILLIDPPLTQIPTPSPWSACMPWCYCLVGR